MITWTTLAVIYCAAGVLIATRLGIPVASLAAPAAVVAVALGLGSQRIVQDILAGFFIITERQYGFGDLISVSVPGLPSPSIGTVEDVTLRVARTDRQRRGGHHPQRPDLPGYQSRATGRGPWWTCRCPPP